MVARLEFKLNELCTIYDTHRYWSELKLELTNFANIQQKPQITDPVLRGKIRFFMSSVLFCKLSIQFFRIIESIFIVKFRECGINPKWPLIQSISLIIYRLLFFPPNIAKTVHCTTSSSNFNEFVPHSFRIN